MEAERQHEKELFREMLKTQKNMFKETTNQFLDGLRNIFNPTTMFPTEIPVSIIISNSQQFIGCLLFSNNFQSQATSHSNPSMCPGNPVRSVLVNLNRGTIAKNTGIRQTTISKPSEESPEKSQDS